VEVHVHGGSKRKALVSVQKGVRKDMKKVRVKLMGSTSTSGIIKPEACLIELPETFVRYDIDINLAEAVISSIDNMEPNAMIKTMLEFNNKALILGWRVGNLLQKEIKEAEESKGRGSSRRIEDFGGQA